MSVTEIFGPKKVKWLKKRCQFDLLKFNLCNFEIDAGWAIWSEKLQTLYNLKIFVILEHYRYQCYCSENIQWFLFSQQKNRCISRIFEDMDFRLEIAG